MQKKVGVPVEEAIRCCDESESADKGQIKEAIEVWRSERERILGKFYKTVRKLDFTFKTR